MVAGNGTSVDERYAYCASSPRALSTEIYLVPVGAYGGQPNEKLTHPLSVFVCARCMTITTEPPESTKTTDSIHNYERRHDKYNGSRTQV